MGFEKCPTAVYDLGKKLIEQYHGPTLGETGIRVGYRFAFGPRDKDGALKHEAILFDNHPQDSSVSFKSPKDRVLGSDDAVIDIDGDEWDDHNDDKKEAILDGALSRINLVLDEPDENGNVAVKLDDSGRPKLTLRPFDWLVRGYSEVIDRHGVNTRMYDDAVAFVKEFKKHEKI